MKKKLTLIFALFGLIFIGQFFFFKKKKIAESVEDTVSHKLSAIKKPKRGSLLNHEAIEKIIKKSKTKKTKHSPENRACPNLLEELKSIDDVPDFEYLEDCPNLAHYGDSYKVFKKACGQSFKKQNKKQRHLCGHSLFILKAKHAELLTEGLDIKAIDSTENLIYKFFYRIMGEGTRESLLDISERVLELEPGLKEFKILNLISYFEAVISRRNNLTQDHFKNMEQHFEDLFEDKASKDREGLYELRLLTMMNSDKHSLNDVKETLFQMERELPDSGILDYYKASLKNQENKRQEALGFLKRAIKKSPKEKRFKYTYNKLLKADKEVPASNAFIFQLRFKGLPL
ncbi:hypothetical protein OAK75_04890 [Bacteriovoracales bacterium]|nr:hypothetical protein [Bacteriovoracales bacterium]